MEAVYFHDDPEDPEDQEDEDEDKESSPIWVKEIEICESAAVLFFEDNSTFSTLAPSSLPAMTAK
jgi:hypothetical protein